MMVSFVRQPEVGNSVIRAFQRCFGKWREKMTPSKVSLGVSVCLSYRPGALKSFRLCPLCVWLVFAGKVWRKGIPSSTLHEDLSSKCLYFFTFYIRIWGRYRSSKKLSPNGHRRQGRELHCQGNLHLQRIILGKGREFLRL